MSLYRDLRESSLAFAAILLLLLAAIAISRSPEIFNATAPDAIDLTTSDLPKDETPAISNADIPPELLEETFATAPDDVAPKPIPWLEYQIRRGDTMEKILNNIGADKETTKIFVAQKLKSYRLLRRGERLLFRQQEGNLSEVLYKTSPDYYLTAKRDEKGIWQIAEAPPTLETVERAAGGRIISSLFEAADKAGLSDSAINLLIESLETQVDFYRDTRKNDTFRIVYTEDYDEYGEALSAKNLLAVEYINLLNPNKPRIIRAAWSPEHKGYYTENGESIQGAFLRAPLKFRRISSRFTNRRYHPVLKKWRAHRGVDYAAATGAPVRATANGTIIKVAKERGYGRVIFIKHFNIYTTVYAHLSRFASTIRKGRSVTQGQVIGYVGQSGLATGPHLHYEFRARGVYKDPLSTAIPKVLPPLRGDDLSTFKKTAALLFAELDKVVI